MKSIFENEARNEVITRINSLTSSSQAHWGKMTVAQMVKHCALCEEYYYGNIAIKRSWLGRIFGRSAIKGILKDENSKLQKNAPTSPQFIVNDLHYDLEEQKLAWIDLVARYATYSNEEFTHWFFGKMTKRQLGQFIYKHSDHHLKQFGA